MRTIRLAIIAIAAVAALSGTAAEHFTYVYSRNSHWTIVNGGANFEMLAGMKSRWGTPFLWFQSQGKSFVIRDAATLAEIDRLFATLDVAQPQYDALRRRMQPLEEQEQELDRKIEVLEDQLDALEDRRDEAAQTSQLNIETKMRDLEVSMRSLESKMRIIEAEEEKLDRQRDKLEREAERKLIPLVEKAISTGIAQRV
jgi:flagellar motility protein MotE (MotC chaperone)